MKILFLTKSELLKHCFSARLSKYGHSCKFTTTLGAVHDMFMCYTPDLVLIDFDSYDYEEPQFDLIHFLAQFKPHFSVHFLHKLDAKGREPEDTSAEYKEIMIQVKEVMKELDSYKYIASDNFSENDKQMSSVLKSIGLPSTLAKTFRPFLQHPYEQVSTDSIMKSIWDKKSAANRNTLYTYIFKLKKYLEKNDFGYTINRTEKGNYVFTYKEEVPYSFPFTIHY